MKIDLVHTNNFQVFFFPCIPINHSSAWKFFFVANIDQKLMDYLPATSSVAFSADLALPTLSNISGFPQKKHAL